MGNEHSSTEFRVTEPHLPHAVVEDLYGPQVFDNLESALVSLDYIKRKARDADVPPAIPVANLQVQSRQVSAWRRSQSKPRFYRAGENYVNSR